MDEETKTRIFEPFFTTKFTGRGLGMAAVLGIVRGHKGAIVLDTAPGKGTTFRFLFPAMEGRGVEASEQSQDEERTQDGTRAQGTVLVVDDEQAVRALTAKILERQGFTVLTAADGREAIKVFREHTDEIACVLLDLTMPVMGGERAFDELRAIRPDIRVILSSGYDEKEVSQRFAGKGVAGFIQKPYQSEALVTKVGEVLGE